jgi:uncharacterized protein YcfL
MKHLLIAPILLLALNGCASTQHVSHCDLPSPVFFSNRALDELAACPQCKTIAVDAVDATKVMLELKRRADD